MSMPSLYGIAFTLGIMFTANALAAAGDNDFKQGLKAFRAEQYEKAVKSFEQAKRKGNKSSALFYNLGVSYYKTKQYPKAEQAFTQLLKDNKFRQLAQYNLGLVNLEQKRTLAAVDWFYLASDKNGDPKITALANRMLDIYDPQKPKQTTSGIISLAYGHDSNVNIVSTESPTHESDTYLELFGFVNIPAGPVVINADLYRQDYQTVNTADFTQLSGGLLYPIKTNGWDITPSIHLAKSELDSNPYETIIDARLDARTRLTPKSELLLRYRYSDISANDSAYNYLEGSRQQFRAQHTSDTEAGQLRLRYELELNDRLNLPTANYSPTRHTLRARLRQSYAGNWQFKEELSWRDSQYDEAAGITRSDKRYQLMLAADNRLTKDWHAGLRYTYTDNKSNLATETYTRNDAQIYADWRF